ncbi:MAG: Hsp20/alpha crystallin family protein [Chloroherpetonaceae bacterium]
MLVKFNQNPFAVIDRVFDDVFRDTMPVFNSAFNPNAMRVDIAEDEKNIYIEAELAGMKKEDVKVSIEDNVLTIRGERKQENEEKKKNYHRVERVYGSFSRAFTLGENIDKDNIEAKYEDGVLRLTLPKVEPVKNVKEIALK